MSRPGRDWDAFSLLLIDVQKDFWTEGMSQDLAAYESNIGRLLEVCRSEGIDVVHVRARFRQDQSDWMARYRLAGRIPCIEGTPGVEVFPFAQAAPEELVMHKQSFDAFLMPELAEHLASRGKRFLLVAGLVTSVCVLLTASAAAQGGYLVALVEDCCADKAAAHDNTLAQYPFVFERTTVDDLRGNHDKWRADLARIAG